MKAIVHIGDPKTGTTSIQNFLYRNAARLAQRGIRYHRNVPRHASQFEYPMAALARSGTLPARASTRLRFNARTVDEARANYLHYADALKQWPQRYKEPSAVFSSEHFAAWLQTPEQVAQADRMLRDAFSEVRYILYIRRQDDLVVSRYSELLRQGNDETLDQFLGHAVKSLSHLKKVTRWEQTVGRDRLDVRLLEPDALVNGDLISDFCEACGIDETGLNRPPRANESLSAPGAEALRSLNTQIPEMLPEGGRNPLRKHLVRSVFTLSADAPKLRLTAEQQARVQAAVQHSNEELRRSFFPDRKTLFASRGTVDTAHCEREMQAEALRIMTQVVIALRLHSIPALSRRDIRRSVTKNTAPVPLGSSGRARLTEAVTNHSANPALRFVQRSLHKFMQT